MKNMNTWLIVLAICMLLATITDVFLFQIFLIISIGVMVLFTQFDRLKKLHIRQMIGIGVYVIAIVLGTASLFYYVYRPVLGLVPVDFIRVISTWIVMIITLYGVGLLLHVGLKKLTRERG